MSFMIDEDDVDEAVRSLHAAFFVDPDPEIFDISARNEAAPQKGLEDAEVEAGKTKAESVHL
jgi:aspartate kinase